MLADINLKRNKYEYLIYYFRCYFNSLWHTFNFIKSDQNPMYLFLVSRIYCFWVQILRLNLLYHFLVAFFIIFLIKKCYQNTYKRRMVAYQWNRIPFVWPFSRLFKNRSMIFTFFAWKTALKLKKCVFRSI